MNNYFVTPANGNIFLDIGFPPEEAAGLLAKSELILTIKQTIERCGLTQKEAAKVCGTDQPTLSKIFRGRLESVTIDRLAAWLSALGRPVEIHIMPYRHAAKRRYISVVNCRRATPPSPRKTEKKPRKHA